MRAEFKRDSSELQRTGWNADLALAYGNASDSSASFIVGMRGSYDALVNWGVLTPTMRLEYGRLISGDCIQPLSFADGTGPLYVLAQDLSRHDSIGAALGMKARINERVIVDGEYGFAATTAAHQHSVRAGIKDDLLIANIATLRVRANGGRRMSEFRQVARDAR